MWFRDGNLNSSNLNIKPYMKEELWHTPGHSLSLPLNVMFRKKIIYYVAKGWAFSVPNKIFYDFYVFF